MVPGSLRRSRGFIRKPPFCSSLHSPRRSFPRMNLSPRKPPSCKSLSPTRILLARFARFSLSNGLNRWMLNCSPSRALHCSGKSSPLYSTEIQVSFFGAAMSLSALIVDDEQLARDELAFLLKNTDDVNVVAQGKNGLEAVNIIKEHNPDLVFLDVQMPGLDGFGVIKKLLDKKVPLPKIVFATAFDQYAVKAFEVNAVDYLLKPFDRKRVAQSVERARAMTEVNNPSADKLDTLVRMLESQKPQTSKILLKTSGRLFLVSQRDICFASIEDGNISVVT